MMVGQREVSAEVNHGKPVPGSLGLAALVSIGGMIGGGIFSVLGLTVRIARGARTCRSSPAGSWRR